MLCDVDSSIVIVQYRKHIGWFSLVPLNKKLRQHEKKIQQETEWIGKN